MRRLTLKRIPLAWKFPPSGDSNRYGGSLLREGVSIGLIVIGRTESRAFSDREIGYSQSFCRSGRDRDRKCALVGGLQERNAELREALEYQIATAEVLAIISRSPTDAQRFSMPSL